MLSSLLSVVLLAQPVPPPALQLQLSVSDVKAETTIFSTSTLVTTRKPFHVNVTQGEGAVHVAVEIESLDRDEAIVRVQWDESTSKGQRVKWQPSVRVKRGVTTEIRLEWQDGGGRLLRLTASP